ncbi:hypothetical protein [Actinomycetospora aeridis]|uniref:Uncharacterized protein n=1 Tax=Actinomycetospora aeridis TaxID=3129231 RepID=A0ABU8N162_9PSEU
MSPTQPVAPRPAHEVIAGWSETLRTTRHVTLPPLVAVGLGVVGTLAHLYVVAAAVFTALWVWGVWVSACSIPDLPQRSAVPKPLESSSQWERVWLSGRRNVERVFAIGALVSAGGWSAAVSWFGPTVWLAVVGLVLLAPLWAAWFQHRRVRLSVEVELDVSAWGDGAEVGLPGTAARALAAGAGWFSLKVSPKRGEDRRLHTHDMYRASIPRIAALFGVRARDVTMKESEREAEVTFVVRTVARETVAPPLDLTMDRIAGPKRLGTTDDGEVVNTALYLDGREGKGAGGQHRVSIGVTGSGKSSEANVDCAISARAVDDMLIVWDFSYGAAELRAWADCTVWFCYTPEQAMDSLRWVIALCEHRGANMRSRFHKPSKKRPGFTIVADELASMFAPQLLDQTASLIDAANAEHEVQQRVALWTSGLRLFRKYAGKVRGTTQYGVDASLGGETAKQQLTMFRTVFRCARDQDAAQIVPLALARTSTFPMDKPGTAHHIGPTTESGGQRLRVDYLDDATIATMVEAWKDHQPSPEALTDHPLWVNRNRRPPEREGESLDDATDTDGDDDEEGGRPALEDPAGGPATVEGSAAARELPAVPPAPETVPEPETVREPARRRMTTNDQTLMAVWGTLATQGWVASSAIASVHGYSPRWASKVLGQLEREGKAQRDGNGKATRWKAIPKEDWPSDRVPVGSGTGAR